MFSHDIALSIKLSWLNESLKISPERDFVCVCYAANCDLFR